MDTKSNNKQTDKLQPKKYMKQEVMISGIHPTPGRRGPAGTPGPTRATGGAAGVVGPAGPTWSSSSTWWQWCITYYFSLSVI